MRNGEKIEDRLRICGLSAEKKRTRNIREEMKQSKSPKLSPASQKILNRKMKGEKMKIKEKVGSGDNIDFFLIKTKPMKRSADDSVEESEDENRPDSEYSDSSSKSTDSNYPLNQG